MFLHLKGCEGKEGVTVVHNDELETVAFPRKMKHVLWWRVSHVSK